MPISRMLGRRVGLPGSGRAARGSLTNSTAAPAPATPTSATAQTVAKRLRAPPVRSDAAQRPSSYHTIARPQSTPVAYGSRPPRNDATPQPNTVVVKLSTSSTAEADSTRVGSACMPRRPASRTGERGIRAAPWRTVSRIAPTAMTGSSAAPNTRTWPAQVKAFRKDGFGAKNSHSMPTKKPAARVYRVTQSCSSVGVPPLRVRGVTGPCGESSATARPGAPGRPGPACAATSSESRRPVRSPHSTEPLCSERWCLRQRASTEQDSHTRTSPDQRSKQQAWHGSPSYGFGLRW
jgi:hypothetical protein